MKRESYNIVLISANGVGTTNTNRTYSFDFNQIHDNGPFEMTWTFSSGINNLGNYTPALVYLDFGQTNSYISNTNHSSSITKMVGALWVNSNGNYSSFQNATNCNPPIYIDSLKSITSINVRILTDTGAYWVDGSLLDLTSYVLTLHLKPV